MKDKERDRKGRKNSVFGNLFKKKPKKSSKDETEAIQEQDITEQNARGKVGQSETAPINDVSMQNRGLGLSQVDERRSAPIQSREVHDQGIQMSQQEIEHSTEMVNYSSVRTYSSAWTTHQRRSNSLIIFLTRRTKRQTPMPSALFHRHLYPGRIRL